MKTVIGLQKLTIYIIIIMLIVVYLILGYQYLQDQIVKARLEERETIRLEWGRINDSVRTRILTNQEIIKNNQDTIKLLLKLQ
jgi:hypothetical protein